MLLYLLLCHYLHCKLSPGRIVRAYAYGSEGALAKFSTEGVPFLDIFFPHEFELLEIVNMQRSIFLHVWPFCGLLLQVAPDVRDEVFFGGILVRWRHRLLWLQLLLPPDLGLAGRVVHHLLPIVAQRISVALPRGEKTLPRILLEHLLSLIHYLGLLRLRAARGHRRHRCRHPLLLLVAVFVAVSAALID